MGRRGAAAVVAIMLLSAGVSLVAGANTFSADDPEDDVYSVTGFDMDGEMTENVTSESADVPGLDLLDVSFNASAMTMGFNGLPVNLTEGNYTSMYFLEINGTNVDVAFMYMYWEYHSDVVDSVYGGASFLVTYPNGTSLLGSINDTAGRYGNNLVFEMPGALDTEGFDVDGIMMMYPCSLMDWTNDTAAYMDFLGDEVTIEGETITPDDLGMDEEETFFDQAAENVANVVGGINWTWVIVFVVVVAVVGALVAFFTPDDRKCAQGSIAAGADDELSGLNKARCVFKRPS